VSLSKAGIRLSIGRLVMSVFKNEKHLRELLRGIVVDKESGAHELAVSALRALSVAGPVAGASPVAYRRAVLELCRRLSRLRPAMVPIGGVASRFAREFAVRTANAKDAAKAGTELRLIARTLEKDLGTLHARIKRNFFSRFPAIRKPMVLSYSSALLAVLGARKNRFDVVVCESRPLCEGRKLAGRLRGRARSIALITEAMMVSVMEECDCAMMGCDAILPDGSVINKMGSHLLALAARSSKRPVIVLGDTYKMGPGFIDPGESHRRSEVWKGAPSDIEVRNLYFERVPASLIDFIVTERGVHRTGGIRALCEKTLGEQTY
jgi:translation initiation factor 2B subunit (eIF-2B alpha/beta/delta family)